MIVIIKNIRFYHPRSSDYVFPDCFFTYLFIMISAIIKATGKTTPKIIPRFMSPSKTPVMDPTKVGPAAQPKSPPKASKANIAVPPLLAFAAATEKVPGHIIPTENPTNPHPISDNHGDGDSEITR